MKLFALSATLLAATVSLAQANSQPICMSTTELEASLVDWYGEQPVRQINENSVLWASQQKGSWTVVTHKQNRTSCVIEQGEGWTLESMTQDLVAELK